MKRIEALPPAKAIVLFDGVCNLCNRAVQFIIDHDKKDLVRFAALQSEAGAAILEHIAVDSKAIDSIVLYIPGKAYYLESDASLAIAKLLGWQIPARAAALVPKFMRDAIYKWVAGKRYDWYGKREYCMVPSPDLTAKFLE